jgi:carbohydrate kinase (thermoresistant glucokinase family)
MRIVMMGVSGCGKTTVGRGLAQALGLPFVEGDELHPPRNVERMRAGIPLTDDDRKDWLDRVAESLAARTGVVVSCSALKRRYRERLRRAAPDLRLVHLRGAPALLAERLAARRDHYMPPSLLQSQLDALEPPAPEEQALVLDIDAAPEALVAAARQGLHA